MIKQTKTFISNMFWKNKEIYEKPLNWLSVIILIAFDIFLFFNIFSGYSYQRNMIVAPHEEYSCEYFYNYQNEENLINILNDYYKYDYKNTDDNFLWDYCKKLVSHVNDLKSDNSFSNFLDTLVDYNDKISDLEYQKNEYEYEYSSYLWESSAWIKNPNDRLTDLEEWSIKTNYQKIISNIEEIQKQKKLTIEAFTSWNDNFKSLVNYINSTKDEFKKSYDDAIFWYPVKVAFFQAILLLPLFLVSLFFYSYFLRRKNRVFTILFSNLLFITWIFVFVLFLKVIYFILPKKFFVSIFEFLKSLSLLFIWNYILVIIWIVIFGFLIIWIQKAFEKWDKIKEEQKKEEEEKNKKRIQFERYAKKRCIDCNSTLLDNAEFCNICWENQFYECENCKTKVPKIFDFCQKCWNKKD